MIISNRSTSNCRCSRFRVGRRPAEPSNSRTLFAISPAFHGTETWCLLHRRDLGQPNETAGRSPMRQSLFVRPNGELAAAGLTEVKTASAGEFKNLACDLAAEFLHLGQHLLQLGLIKDHKRRARVHSRGFF